MVVNIIISVSMERQSRLAPQTAQPQTRERYGRLFEVTGELSSTASPPDVRWRLCPTELVCHLTWGYAPSWGAAP
jgi:hypothetical protein